MRIQYSDDEKITFKKKIVYPIYSVKDSLKLFNKILRKILVNKNYKKRFIVKNYNILSIALEDFFWQYCFQYIKYKSFIKKEGINLNIIKTKNKTHYHIDGYGRVQDYLKGNFNIKNILKFFIKNCYFYLWILLNALINKNKNWVDRRFDRDFRYDNLKIERAISITLPYSLQSFRPKSNNIEEALMLDAEAKIKNYKKWIFAIKILKPKKIMMTDNLYDNFSLLMAAKITKTECIAICHAPVIKHHMNLVGTNLLKKNLLLFDKIFVYHKIFKNFLLKNGKFYTDKKIEITNWPNTNKYNFKIKKNKKNIYVLYPFEHFCDFKKINEFLIFFQKKNHKIIIKTRPDMSNYGHFDSRLNIDFVDDFTKEHFLNSLCVIGSTTTLLFNCAQNFLPIIYIDDNGYDHFKDIEHPKNWIRCKNINNKIYKKILENPNKNNFQFKN